MPLRKHLTKQDTCKVTFTLPAEQAQGCLTVYLVGEFNDWDEFGLPMKRGRQGAFTRTLELTAGRDYRFRYRLDDGQWVNEPGADRYEHCAYGACDNSVVSL
ncbi:MAG: isoamylase early set domain-containing protein [Desulfovibrionaceae bacterium]